MAIIEVVDAKEKAGKEAYMKDELRITLEAARINAGLTQAEVAEKLGVSRSTVINWELHRTSPSVSQANALCALYKRPYDSIIF